MKQKRLKKSCILLLIFVFGSIFLGCSSKTNDNFDKTIKVGTNAEFPPFEYMNDSGEVDGFDVALMKAIGQEMGYNIQFTNMEFKSLTASLKTGGLDAVIAGMTITDERKQTVDFSDSYYTATQSIIIPQNSNITSLEELNGKKIAVQEGTTGDIIVTPGDDNEIIKEATVKRFKKGSDAIIELQNGGVDAVVIDENPAKNFVNKNSDTLKLVQDTSTTEEYAIAVGKGNSELLKDINTGLEKVKANGKFDELVNEYINGAVSETQEKSDNVFVNFINKVKFVFIDTKGYELLLKGIGVTLGISALAVCLGIVIGFVVALMKLTETRKGRKTILSRIANIYIDVLRGTPVMVQLLIIYMIIFKNNMGIVAAVITFGINSGAYVAENIRAGIMAVDHGQMEGGRSLGFSYGETMRYIIMPQAIKNILPALGNEMITLVKETSIVGYVAIVDLTKAADFIISRTYETFLPLIAIAIIYYVIVKIMTKLLLIMERRLRKSDIR
ncbi:MAG: ABC transporter permease subunit [Clostridiales bacterium]|nr:ABC transporter permease subunit [Clostridiales bacterium]